MTTTLHPYPAVLRAERWSALSTPAAKLLLAMSVGMAAVSMVANLSVVDTLESDDTVQLAMHASTVATLIFALLAGVYSATSDHRFGLIDHRLLSQPRRSVVLGAKAIMAATVGLLYGVLGALVAIVVAVSYYSANDASFPVDSPLVHRALLGVMVAAPLFAVLGVAIGTIVKNQPAALGGSLAWLLIVEPTLLIGAPDIGQWFPGAAGLSLTHNPTSDMTQPLAAVLLVAYATAAMALAVRRLQTSDI